jgi:hypothetical protein
MPCIKQTKLIEKDGQLVALIKVVKNSKEVYVKYKDSKVKIGQKYTYELLIPQDY